MKEKLCKKLFINGKTTFHPATYELRNVLWFPIFCPQFLWASSWLRVKVRLLIKSFTLIYIMRHWKICLNLRDPIGPSPIHSIPIASLRSPSPTSSSPACLHACLRVTPDCDPQTQQGLCAAPWGASAAASVSTGRNLLLRWFGTAERWFGLISPTGIPFSDTWAQLWRASFAIPLLLHVQKKKPMTVDGFKFKEKKNTCGENASVILNKAAERRCRNTMFQHAINTINQKFILTSSCPHERPKQTQAK